MQESSFLLGPEAVLDVSRVLFRWTELRKREGSSAKTLRRPLVLNSRCRTGCWLIIGSRRGALSSNRGVGGRRSKKFTGGVGASMFWATAYPSFSSRLRRRKIPATSVFKRKEGKAYLRPRAKISILNRAGAFLRRVVQAKTGCSELSSFARVALKAKAGWAMKTRHALFTHQKS